MKKLTVEKSGLEVGTITEAGIETQNTMLKDAYDLILKANHTAVEGTVEGETIKDVLRVYRIEKKDLKEIGRALFWAGYHVRYD